MNSQIRTEIRATFRCSLERAFKAPILGDATQFLNGYRFQPGVIAFEEDATWGQPQGVRYPVTAGSLLVRKGRVCKDEILQRVENEYWQWTIYNFETNTLFFATRAVGEWYVRQISPGIVDVRYVYTYDSRNWLTHPLNWAFGKVQMQGMMQKAIHGIQQQAESGCDFVYE